MDQKVSRYVVYSLGAHASLCLFLLIQNFVFPSDAILLQPTVHVDLVALPDQTKAPEENVDPTLPVTESPPKEEAAPAIEEPAPLETPKAIEKPKDRAKDAKKALEKLKEEVAKQKKQERESLVQKERDKIKSLEEKSRRALRGNQVNQGTSATGILEQTINAYAGHVTERLRSNWALPTWLQSRNLRAVVRIYIDSQGRINRFVFKQNSGDESFDSYVKATVEKSSPFAPPPNEMARQLQSSGMEVSFPL